jgi:hypothetical protein
MGRPGVRAAIVLSAVLSLAFFDVVFLGRTLQVSRTIATTYPTGPYGVTGPPPASIPITDNTPGVLEEPYLAFKRHELAAGRVPLWNPHQAAGMPFAANPEATLFFPPDLALYLLPPAYAWDVLLLLRLLAAGLFTALFLRTIGCGEVAAIGGGIAYMLGGPAVTWLNNVTMNPDCLLPLLLYAVELVLRGARPWAVPLAAAVIGLSVLGGHPEHTFFVQLTAGLYLAHRIWHGAGTPGATVRAGAAALLGLGVAGILLVPFVELWVRGAWTYHVHAVGLDSDETPARAITILLPYLFQPELVTYGYQHAGWLGGYLGVGTVALGVLGMSRDTPRRLGPLFGAILLVGLAKCYAVPGINLLGALPVLRHLRFSLHLTAVVGFAAAVLAGLGLDRIARGRVALRQAVVAALGLLTIMVVFVGINLAELDTSRAVPALVPGLAALVAVPVVLGLVDRGVLGRVAAGVALVAVVTAELLADKPDAHPARYEPFREPPYVRWLRARPGRPRVFGMGPLFPDTASAFQLDDLAVYEGIFLERFTRFVRTLVDPRRFTGASMVGELRGALPDYGNPFLDLLGVRYLIAAAGTVTDVPPGMALVYDADVAILERPAPLARAFTVDHWVVVGSQEEALAALREGFDFRSGVLLEGAEASLAASGAPGAPARPARILEYTPNRVVVEAAVDAPAVLVLADAFYPGWVASVDGRPQPVHPADALFRAVPLPGAGTHRVEFTFAPRSVDVGAAISLVSLVLLVVAWRWGARPRDPGSGDVRHLHVGRSEVDGGLHGDRTADQRFECLAARHARSREEGRDVGMDP